MLCIELYARALEQSLARALVRSREAIHTNVSFYAQYTRIYQHHMHSRATAAARRARECECAHNVRLRKCVFPSDMKVHYHKKAKIFMNPLRLIKTWSTDNEQSKSLRAMDGGNCTYITCVVKKCASFGNVSVALIHFDHYYRINFNQTHTHTRYQCQDKWNLFELLLLLWLLSASLIEVCDFLRRHICLCLSLLAGDESM